MKEPFFSFEDELAMLMMGREKAPAEQGPNATEMKRTQHTALTQALEKENGKVYTRMLLDTTDSPSGDASVAAQSSCAKKGSVRYEMIASVTVAVLW